jgi:uncharacterized protein (DUF1697 family)
MTYVALLRGINVGGNRKVEMQKLKTIFESLECSNVSTYINSGNVVFDTNQKPTVLHQLVSEKFRVEFGFEIPTLLKTQTEMKQIAASIPSEWKNDPEQKTDVAYLFPTADTADIIQQLPVKLEYLTTKYVPGALIWNVQRENLSKSQLNKLISHQLYKQMTIRNSNTARFLGGVPAQK